MKIKNLAVQLIYITMMLAFGLIIIGFFCLNNNPVGENSFYSLIMMLIIGIIVYLYLKYINFNNASDKKKFYIIFSTFIIYFIVSYYFAKELSVTPSWDFGSAFSVATDYAGDGTFRTLDYFYMHPNNHFIIYFFSLILRVCKLVGIDNLFGVGLMINIIMINFTYWILYLYLRKITSFKLAYLGILLIFFYGPLLTYLPIYYSDTLSLPFIVLTLYILTFIDFNKGIKANILYMILLSLIMFIGYNMKATVIIILIAFIIKLILFDNLKNAFVFLGIFISIFIVGTITLSFAYRLFQYDEYRLENEKFNSLHYLMVGTSLVKTDSELVYYGFYNEEDFNRTFYAPQSERISIALNTTISRIVDRGIIDNLSFYYNKLVQTWGDGTYYAPEKLHRYPLDENSLLDQIFSLKGEYYSSYYTYASGFQLFVLFSMIFSLLICLKEKIIKNYFIIFLSLFGIMLFLLLWETRSRYLLNFIPLIVVGMVPGLEKFNSYLSKL